ncbi:inverse autotransporter beta domain-containing protein [Pantoea agglomerans]
MKNLSVCEIRTLASGWVRKCAYLQIIIQGCLALTPFYSSTSTAAAIKFQEESFVNNTAQHARGLAQAQQSGNAANYFSQQASGSATAEIQSWLQNFGTARVEMSADDRFKLRQGSVDFLYALHKNDDRLAFFQSGLRSLDGQWTINTGFGQRHFVSDWMMGYNVFYDQNTSRNHKRLGSGVELWRDYLKLSGNGYYRLSGWKNSRDVENYDARPANGFDVRAEAWIPGLPSLGGRLMYEQYYGDEVALFSKDRRQKNPSAINAGLSYTPVPLVTFDLDHKRGSSQKETRFGLQLNYVLGQSFSSQITPENTGFKRTLAGSNLDLVDRNNNIVLEYRKQELIRLTLPEDLTGESGKTVPLSYQLKSKYGLSRIDWNDSALTAAGGKSAEPW